MKLGEWKAPSEPSEVGPMKIGQLVLSRWWFSKDFIGKTFENKWVIFLGQMIPVFEEQSLQ